MDEIQALVGRGLADLGMTMAKVGNTNTSGKVEESPAILELSPRSLGADHHRIAGDPPQPLRNVFGTDVL